MRKVCGLILLLGIASAGIAQDGGSLLRPGMLRFNAITPGVSYELRIGKAQTVTGAMINDITFWYQNINGFVDTYFRSGLSYKMDVRHYTNLETRRQRGKSTSRNSGDYVALSAVIRGPELATAGSLLRTNAGFLADDLRFRIGPVWGTQRVAPSDLAFSFDIGAAAYFYSNGVGFGPTLDLTIGFAAFTGE